MRLVFAGTPVTAVPSLLALLASAHEVVAVVTRPDARSGRGRTLAPSPVKEVALEHGLEVLTPVSPRDPDFHARLVELDPDCCPVVAYGALVPRAALDVPRVGWVNLHFSLLPAWRGAAPVQRAIMAGDDVTGATTFLLEEGLDAGPVLGTLTETVRPSDTSGILLDRLARAGAGEPVEQDAAGVARAHRLGEGAEHRPGVEPFLEQEGRGARDVVTGHDRALHGGGPTPGRKQREVQVDPADPRHVERGAGHEGTVGDDRAAVGVELDQPRVEVGVAR